MNKNNIFALVLLAALFSWYIKSNNDQQVLIKAEMEAKKAAEVAEVKEEKVEEEKVLSASEMIKETPKPVVVDTVVKDTIQDSVVVKETLPQKVVVETDNYFVEFDNKGAQISAVVLKSLEDDNGNFPSLLQKEGEGALSFQLGKMDFTGELFEMDSTLKDTIKAGSDTEITFTWKKADVEIKRVYSLANDSWKINQKLDWSGTNPKNYKLFLTAGLTETEEPAAGGFGMADYNFSEVVLKHEEGVDREMLTETTNFDESKLEWAGVRRKYLATLVDFGGPTQTKLKVDTIISAEGYNNTYGVTFSERLESDDVKFSYVILPLAYKQVASFERDYEEIIWSGWNFLGASTWFPAICKYALGFLKTFYAWTGNYGLAIILLTILVKLGTLPLILSQQKNMKKMTQHKPAMDEIRKKYSSEPQRYQQELMSYYKEHGINPLAQMFGCLPMFLQMPVFFSLFIVFSRASELRNAPFFGWITDLSSPDIFFTGISIPFVMPGGLSLLPVIMAVTTYYQTKQTMTDPNMKALVYMMPIMMFAFSGVMPSGLVLYWIISNLFTIVQYALIGTGRPAPVQVSTK